MVVIDICDFKMLLIIFKIVAMYLLNDFKSSIWMKSYKEFKKNEGKTMNINIYLKYI